jgi:hypothetical protein
MYDGKTQLFIENPLDRYLLSSEMMEQFKQEEDGSLVLHIGKDSPGQDLESNWLPAPDGPFYLTCGSTDPRNPHSTAAGRPPPQNEKSNHRSFSGRPCRPGPEVPGGNRVSPAPRPAH